MLVTELWKMYVEERRKKGHAKFDESQSIEINDFVSSIKRIPTVVSQI